MCNIIQIESRKPEASFLIKEKRFKLGLILQERIDIEFRYSNILLDGVLLIPLLIQFNGNPNLIYETWFDYYQSGDVKKGFEYLATQEILRILLKNEHDQPVEVIQVPNSLRLGFVDTWQQLNNLVPWSEDEYECAQSKFLRRYPDTHTLWHGLKKITVRTKLIKNEVK